MLTPVNLQRNQANSMQRLGGQNPLQQVGTGLAQQGRLYADAFERSGNMLRQGAQNLGAGIAGAGAQAADNFRLSTALGESASGGWGFGGRAGYSTKLVNTKHDAHTFADRQWSNRPDSENSDNGTGIPINATLFNVGARRSVTAATASAETSVGGVDLTGAIYAGRLGGMTNANATVDLNSATVKANAGVRGEAHLVGVSASANRRIGTDALNTTSSVKGDAFVGADAGANVGVNFSPRSGSAGVSAGLDAFAGAKAKGKVRQSLGVAGENIGAVGVSGEAWAGIGASANATAGFEDGKFKLSASVGAALGVGGKVGFDVEVDVVGTAKAAVKVGSDAIDAASEVAGDIANAFSSGWDKISSLW